MKVRNKFISGMLVTMAVGASVAGAQAVQNTDVEQDDLRLVGPLSWEQRVDELKLVDEANYEAWQQYMIGSGRQLIADKVTAEDFAKMAELFDAIKAGDYDKAKELGKDLKMPFGLGMGPGMPQGPGKGMRGGAKGAVLNSPKFEALSEEVKNQIKAAHEAGDRELVQKLLEENGLKPAMRKFKDRWGDNENDSEETAS